MKNLFSKHSPPANISPACPRSCKPLSQLITPMRIASEYLRIHHGPRTGATSIQSPSDLYQPRLGSWKIMTVIGIKKGNKLDRLVSDWGLQPGYSLIRAWSMLWQPVPQKSSKPRRAQNVPLVMNHKATLFRSGRYDQHWGVAPVCFQNNNNKTLNYIDSTSFSLKLSLPFEEIRSSQWCRKNLGYEARMPVVNPLGHVTISQLLSSLEVIFLIKYNSRAVLASSNAIHFSSKENTFYFEILFSYKKAKKRKRKLKKIFSFPTMGNIKVLVYVNSPLFRHNHFR